MNRGGEPWTFNLLYDGWIDAATLGGESARLGVLQLLESAHELRALIEPSPLHVAALQRFLAAVTHEALGVETLADVRGVLASGRLPGPELQRWAGRWSGRFDLFSADHPFFQSADIPLEPERGITVKPVGYLAPEIPCATAINHFRHVYDADQALCPACVAKGLVALPAFATSGGAGIRPSINGVPPTYVLPTGRTLHETIALSLVADGFRPPLAATPDVSLWRRPDGVVQRSGVRLDVGYLDSLTFPARRIRLFPEQGPGPCTRCGQEAPAVVRRMVFEMGESRPKEAPQWRDPFAAYRAPKGDKPPMPVRPVEGRATWREFAALFIDTGAGGPHGRPLVLNQIDHLVLGGDLDVNGERVFRCIGVRTDMKAKVFEWMEAALDIPLRLLDDPDAQNTVLAAVGYAEVIADAVRSAFGRFGSRYRRLRMRMLDLYWMDLAGPFREAVLAMSQPDHAALALEDWHRAVRSRARQRLREAADLVGDTGDQLRVRALVLADFDRRAAQAQAQFPTR